MVEDLNGCDLLEVYGLESRNRRWLQVFLDMLDLADECCLRSEDVVFIRTELLRSLRAIFLFTQQSLTSAPLSASTHDINRLVSNLHDDRDMVYEVGEAGVRTYRGFTRVDAYSGRSLTC